MSQHLYQLLVKSIKDEVEFTPATKNGKPVEANFKYTFFF
jgi:hypothetical protein